MHANEHRLLGPNCNRYLSLCSTKQTGHWRVFKRLLHVVRVCVCACYRDL